MDRMNYEGNETKLDALFAEYRSACPDPDSGADFMPNLWRKIEARRMEGVSVFRRMAQLCLVATAALTLLMAVLIPRLQREPVYTANYVDVLDAAHADEASPLQMLEEVDLQ
jgi:hypothetical protein